MSNVLLPRGVLSRLHTLLDATPVVVLEGPRASGKTAIGQMLQAASKVVTVADLGNPTVLGAARSSPTTFVDDLITPAFIDEAQLLPELLLAVKRRVDRERKVGSFVLTGSSRLGRTQLGGSDPLAGRSARVRLWPMTQGELSGVPVDFVDRAFSGSLDSADTSSVSRPLLNRPSLSRTDLVAKIQRGGLPNLAGILAPLSGPVRRQLMSEYVEGVVEHEIGRRHDRAELIRLFRYLAATTGRLLNVSTVASDLGANRETVTQRVASLESTFLLHPLLAHRTSEHRTVVAHPRVHCLDVGVAAWAARFDDRSPAHEFGAMVETLVVNELAAQASWSDDIVVRHWRNTAKKREVDCVLVHPDGRTIPVEVKAAVDVRDDDLAGLRLYRSEVSGCEKGIIFYTGDLTLQVEEGIWAVPISALWS